MTAWDLYNNQFLLHLVARKKQEQEMGKERWLSEEGLRIYRQGVKEDGVVLENWKNEKERHEGVVRAWMFSRDGFREEERKVRMKTG